MDEFEKALRKNYDTQLLPLLNEAEELGLLAWSSDAAQDADGKGWYVPVDKVEDFMRWIVSRGIPSKPYVGKKFHIKRHKKMYALSHLGWSFSVPGYENGYLNSNVEFNKVCEILDESDNQVKIKAKNGKEWWIKRYYLEEEVP